jgi:hypothetical protein
LRLGALFWRSLWVRRVLNVVMPPWRPFNASTNGRGGKGHRSELFMAFRSMPSRSAIAGFYTRLACGESSHWHEGSVAHLELTVIDMEGEK